MNRKTASLTALLALLAAGLIMPYVAPAHLSQLSMLWLFMVLALSWDLMSGQTGYNSFGNVVFFGIGMYASAALQIGLYHPVAEYTAAMGEGTEYTLDAAQIYAGLALGVPFGGLVAMLAAILFGALLLGMRGHHFAIATLGLAVAAAELAASRGYIGTGFDMPSPTLPNAINSPALFYWLSFALAALALIFYMWLLSTRFRLALNAIRDDEDKAEAMGHFTVRNKMTAWAISAFFTGLAGALYGNLSRSMAPHDVAYSGMEVGVWMILMAILGGRGTFWGPVIGTAVFFGAKELFWTYLPGWQHVLLGALIVIIVAFFPQGIIGWLRERWPNLFAKPEPDEKTTSHTPPRPAISTGGNGHA